MRTYRLVEDPVGAVPAPGGRELRSPQLPMRLPDKRRAYNRAYMRLWRSDPRHRACERASRQKAYYLRKLRDALRKRVASPKTPAASLCGLCGRLPPVCEILRLRIRELPAIGLAGPRSEFVEVRIPYCGQC